MSGILAAASLIAVPAFAANPFSDVPQKHWAYDAVAELSAKSVLEGYPDSTFKGGRAMNRYEIAQMVSRLMNTKFEDADADKLKALIAEFAPELKALGVKLDGFDDRLSALESGVKGWRITGQFRYDYNAWDKDVPYNGSYTGASVDGFTVDRARLYFHKDIANKITFDARYHDDKFDRYYLQARDFLGVKGFTFKAGQFFLDWEAADKTYIDNDAYAMDTQYRGIQLTKTIGPLGYVTAFASSQRGSGTYGIYTNNASNEVYGVRAKLNFNEKFWMTANGLFNNISDNNYKQIWVALGVRPAKGLELRGVYYIEDLADKAIVVNGIDDPKSWKVILDIKQSLLKFTGLWLEYAQIDEGYRMDHNPWAFSGIEWPSTSQTWQVKEDHKICFARAEQRWTKKWSTFERFVNYDPDGASSYKEWTVGVKHQYTSNLSFELAYDKHDGRRNDADWDNNVIRFRTFLQF